MKRITSRLGSLCAVVVLVLTLSIGVVASCDLGYGVAEFTAYLTSERGGYCYYDIECSWEYTQAQCDAALHREGFQIEGIDYE